MKKSEVQAYNRELAKIVEMLLPTVEAAYWDHSSAGHMPGSGYNHNCYNKLPFNWRQTEEFTAFINRAKELIK